MSAIVRATLREGRRNAGTFELVYDVETDAGPRVAERPPADGGLEHRDHLLRAIAQRRVGGWRAEGFADVAAREIRVRAAWDDEEGEIEAKSKAGRRTLPILAVLAPELAAHKLRTGRDGHALVFGTTPEMPFEPSTVRRRALKAWREAKVESIGLHEARHTFASLLIAAGVNAKAIMEFMGHATIAMTFDRYYNRRRPHTSIGNRPPISRVHNLRGQDS